MEDVFAPPLSSGPIADTPRTRRWLDRLVRVLQATLLARMASLWLVPVVMLLALGLPTTESDTGDEVGFSLDLVPGLLALANLILYHLLLILGWFLWAVWSYVLVSEIYARTRQPVARAEPEFPHHPALAVIWWLVPLANLAMPFLVLRDAWMWMGAAPHEQPQGDYVPHLLTLWWVLLIAWGVMWYLGAMGRVEGLAWGFLVSAGSGVAEAAGLGLSIWLVGAFQARLRAWRTESTQSS